MVTFHPKIDHCKRFGDHCRKSIVKAWLPATLVIALCCACSTSNDPTPDASSPDSSPPSVGDPSTSTTFALASLPFAEAEYREALAAAPIERSAFQRTMISAVCLQGKGWEPSVDRNTPDGIGLVGKAANDPSMIDQFRNDHKACVKEHQLDEHRPLSRELLAEEYAQRLKQQDCLVKAGVSVIEPPTRETFIEQRLQEAADRVDRHIWNPADQLADADLPRNKYEELASKCIRTEDQ